MCPVGLLRDFLSCTPLQNNLDYIDDNADKLARKKMRADHMKRQFAINGMCLFVAHGECGLMCVFRLQEDDEGPCDMSVLLWRRRFATKSTNHSDGHSCLPVVYSQRGADRGTLSDRPYFSPSVEPRGRR